MVPFASSLRMIKITLFTFILIGLSCSKFLLNNRDNILSQEIFGISAFCNNPTLGNNIAEFQMMKSSHTYVSFDIQKNFDLLGIPNNKTSNPQRMKILNLVVDHTIKKRAEFWVDEDNKLHKEKQISPFGIENYLVPCIMWVEVFLPVSET